MHRVIVRCAVECISGASRLATPPAYLNYFFFFNDTATTEIYTLSLHDALPISMRPVRTPTPVGAAGTQPSSGGCTTGCRTASRSEEHTSELQSQSNLVCRLLLEKKKRQTLGHRRRVRSSLVAHTHR